MATTFVSVLIDTYNHERFIEEALASVLAQDYPVEAREIIVVDDGSTDRTPEILRRFESQAKILRKPNAGQASAFNFAIPQCKGEIVAFLDGDDWWARNKLPSVVAAFQQNPGVGLVGHGITETFPDGTLRSEMVHQSHRVRLDSLEGARTFRLRKSFLGTSRMAYRAELLRRIGQVPESLIFEADEFLFTLGALFSDVLLLREPLTFYRIHGGNLFQTSDATGAALRRKLNVIAALSDSLQQRFAGENTPPEISKAIIESIDLEAGMLRVALGEGSSREAFRTQARSYRIMHEHASLPRRLLKYASLLPALLLSPKTFNSFQQKLLANRFYKWARHRVLPNLRPTHVDRHGEWSSR